VTGGKDSAHEVEWALKFAINSMWRTIWRACLSNGTALSVESMAAQRLDWARRYLGMIPSLSRPSKQTNPDKPQSRDVYKNVACPLVFFCKFECTFPWMLSPLLLPTALNSYGRHMTFLFGRHPVRLRDCDFLPIPPVLHNSSTNASRTPNSRQQLPDDVELVVTASFLSAGNRLFRSRPPCHSRSISERASMRAGLSRKRGSRLRKEHLRFTVQLRGIV
jgi:hypothetical protein